MTATHRALLLDGRRDDEATLAAIHEALVDCLATAGWTLDDWSLRDADISWCVGCFGCWVKTPGVCLQRGAARDVAARMACADLLVYLTPVTFGGYSWQLKKALDHLIPTILPDLRKIGPETHHPHRYERVPDLLVVGTVAAGAGQGPEAQTFRRLVARNVLNLRPGRWAVGVLEDGSGERQLGDAVAALLADLEIRPAPSRASTSPTLSA